MSPLIPVTAAPTPHGDSALTIFGILMIHSLMIKVEKRKGALWGFSIQPTQLFHHQHIHEAWSSWISPLISFGDSSATIVVYKARISLSYIDQVRLLPTPILQQYDHSFRRPSLVAIHRFIAFHKLFCRFVTSSRVLNVK